jgi:hypothetical protein
MTLNNGKASLCPVVTDARERCRPRYFAAAAKVHGSKTSPRSAAVTAACM